MKEIFLSCLCEEAIADEAIPLLSEQICNHKLFCVNNGIASSHLSRFARSAPRKDSVEKAPRKDSRVLHFVI
ncbi:hypothetical protein KAI52_00510 [Candidatus Parcubacteria bacterium]|nr:hypothetical protein [Candidatus Parcubacteria bacterium]